MAIQVETKDCTALSDAELAEMGDICTNGPARFDFGLLSKQREEWVLITLARIDDVLVGFGFFTLERVGGTPAILVGLASVARRDERDEVFGALRKEQFRRAVLAFPDEDVLVGSRLATPGGYVAFAGLTDVVPRPGHKATGEERAWGRRLVKRFCVEGTYYDRAFRSAGEGGVACVIDHESLAEVDPEVRDLFADVDPASGDCLVVFGWVLAEELAALQP